MKIKDIDILEWIFHSALFRQFINHVHEPTDTDILQILRNKLLLSIQIYVVMFPKSSSDTS